MAKSDTSCRFVGIPIRFVSLFFCVVLFVNCSSDRHLLNEENPFYKRGIQLQLDGNYEDATMAFKQCLKYSPESYKANLQLAVIYEDHERDYPLAIVHYTIFIENATNIEDIELAQQWLSRAEKKYFEKLRFVYSEPVVDGGHETIPQKEKKGTSDDPMADVHQTSGGEKFTNRPNVVDHHHPDTKLPTQVIPGAGVEISKKPHQDFYIVQQGDTLARIAERLTGDQNNWRDLYELNKDVVKSPELLQIGQRLRIPPITSDNQFDQN